MPSTLTRLRTAALGAIDRAGAWLAPPLSPLSPEDEEAAIGAGVARLLTRSDWVHRRTELVHFLDSSTVHRQMGVDFTLPEDDLVSDLVRLRPGVVPLATLRKRPLSNFGMWDEEGRRLPLLNTAENGYYAAAALVASAIGVAALYRSSPFAADWEAATGGGEVPAAVLDCLRALCHLEGDAALGVFHRMAGEPLAKDEEEAVASSRLARDAVAALVGQDEACSMLLTGPPVLGVPDLAREQARPRIEAVASAVRSLVEQLAREFIVFTQLRPVDPGARRIVKFSYEQPGREYRPVLPWHKRLTGRIRGLFVTLGWWPERITLDAVAVGSARSYHVEIEAPVDIVIIAASITANDPRRAQDPPFVDDHRSTERQRVHLRIAEAPRAAVGPVWLSLRASRHGFILAAMLTALIVAATLELGRRQLPVMAADNDETADAAAALLLAVPGVVAAYLLRPGEHRLASQMLFGPRAFLLLSGLCAFVAAGVIAGDFSQCTRETVWGIVRWVGWGAAAALVVSWFVPVVFPAIGRRRGSKG